MGSITEQTKTDGTITTLTKGDDYSERLLKFIVKSLDEAKAEDLVSINIEGKSSMADHMVIASGRSTRHVSALAQLLVSKLKEEGYGNSRVEGLKSADWVLIDAKDVIIHIFRPEVRDFYNLEKIWIHDEPQDQAAN